MASAALHAAAAVFPFTKHRRHAQLKLGGGVPRRSKPQGCGHDHDNLDTDTLNPKASWNILKPQGTPLINPKTSRDTLN